MKKVLTATIVLLFVILIGLILSLKNSNLNRLGTERYYLQITSDGAEIVEQAGGEEYIRYFYQLPAYDKDGNERNVDFYSSKNLRNDAYLKIYYKNKKGVTSYEEVKQSEVPEKALQKIQQTGN